MTQHPYRSTPPPRPDAPPGPSTGQVALAVRIALVLLSGARVGLAAATGAFGLEAIVALVLFAVLSARVVRGLRRRL